MHRTLRLIAAAAFTCVAAGLAPAHAATLTGLVATAEGQPVAGALVTLWNEARNRKETVYSDAEGKYRLDTAFTGKVQLRGRAHMYRDFNVEFDLGADDNQQHMLALVRLTDPQEISDSLTASAHAAGECSVCSPSTKALISFRQIEEPKDALFDVKVELVSWWQ